MYNTQELGIPTEVNTITTDDAIYQMIADGDIHGIGELYHRSLLCLLAKETPPAQTFVALSDDQAMMGTVAFRTHEARYERARDVGRAFSSNFHDQEIKFLIMLSAVVSNPADSKVKPNDDPEAEQGAMTFVMDLRKQHEAKDIDDYAQASSDMDYRVWSSVMANGLETSRDYSGATVKSTEQHQWYEPKDDEIVACIDNLNMIQCLIGISSNFRVIREQTEGKTFAEIKAETDSWFESKDKEPDLLAKTRAIKEGKLKPETCPDTFTENDFSQDSLEVLEAFGLEAPTLLNDYACSVEDALVEQVSRNQQLIMRLHQATEIIEELADFKKSVMASLTEDD